MNAGPSRNSVVGGQKKKCITFTVEKEPGELHGELPAINESASGRGEINARVKIEERANCLQICCVKTGEHYLDGQECEEC